MYHLFLLEHRGNIVFRCVSCIFIWHSQQFYNCSLYVNVGLCSCYLPRPVCRLIHHRARGVSRQRQEGEASEKSREHAKIFEAGAHQPEEDDEKGCLPAGPAGGEWISCQVLHDCACPRSQGRGIPLKTTKKKLKAMRRTLCIVCFVNWIYFGLVDFRLSGTGLKEGRRIDWWFCTILTMAHVPHLRQGCESIRSVLRDKMNYWKDAAELFYLWLQMDGAQMGWSVGLSVIYSFLQLPVITCRSNSGTAERLSLLIHYHRDLLPVDLLSSM